MVEEDVEMPSHEEETQSDEEEEESSIATEQPPEESQPTLNSNDPDQLLQLISDMIKEEANPTVNNTINTVYRNSVTNELLHSVDGLFAKWKEDPFYHLGYLDGKITAATQSRSEKYSWVKVGALAWVKHEPFDWWPCFLRSVKNEKGVLKVNVFFIEPHYKGFLSYSKTPNYKRMDKLRQMVPQPVNPQEETRPEQDVTRSKHTWLRCPSYMDNTMFELAERMATMISKHKHRIMTVEKGAKRIKLDILAGLYWYANAIWCRMNGARATLDPPPASCAEWEAHLSELEDVSYWRLSSDVSTFSTAARKRKKDDEEDDIEEESAEDCYGYDYIPLPVRRDPSTIVYDSGETQAIAGAREAYGEALLEKVCSAECQQYLRSLRDMEAKDPRHTWRSRALKTRQTWKFLKNIREIANPTGPIVSDSQVSAVYRAMKVLRRRSDISNVYFMKDCYEVWVPEALIYAIMKVKNCSYDQAEKEYQAPPAYTPEEEAANWHTADTLSFTATQ
ncbi:hypothetical protein RvY_04135 [Ramazzottius varieornatus]|uniref:PWWP domain-containing protein n=1 Tax=Ramazzottius varieornatus TaxID=947166 RepID=A0A1D1UW88_RAMVA|nr:hypothetical protein RvY_04135 [Ramazzottius varieornatus]